MPEPVTKLPEIATSSVNAGIAKRYVRLLLFVLICRQYTKEKTGG